jgi:CheY-like chemotaxis protein
MHALMAATETLIDGQPASKFHKRVAGIRECGNVILQSTQVIVEAASGVPSGEHLAMRCTLDQFATGVDGMLKTQLEPPFFQTTSCPRNGHDVITTSLVVHFALQQLVSEVLIRPRQPSERRVSVEVVLLEEDSTRLQCVVRCLGTPVQRLEFLSKRGQLGLAETALATALRLFLPHARLNVEGDVGHGAEPDGWKIMLSVPCVVETSQATQARIQESTEAATAMQGTQVAVIDDSELNCRVLQRAIEKGIVGAHVDVFSSGDDFLATCSRRPEPARLYDVVLIDENMPGLRGSDTVRVFLDRFRSQGSTGGPCLHPVFIACTADATQGTREMCLATGMFSVLTKPFTRTEVVASMHRALARTGKLQPGAQLDSTS